QFTLVLLYSSDGQHHDLYSFPTRRSSDLSIESIAALRPFLGHNNGPNHGHQQKNRRNFKRQEIRFEQAAAATKLPPNSEAVARRDRKSIRLNSSHVSISYAVFCLKKKR